MHGGRDKKEGEVSRHNVAQKKKNKNKSEKRQVQAVKSGDKRAHHDKQGVALRRRYRLFREPQPTKQRAMLLRPIFFCLKFVV